MWSVVKEGIMNSMEKKLVLCGAGILAAAGLFLVVVAKTHVQPSTYDKVRKGIDESLAESKTALDKATSHIKSVYEQIMNRNA